MPSRVVAMSRCLQLDNATSRQRDNARWHESAIIVSRCRDVVLLRCRDVALSRCRVVALSRCRDVALSRCRDVALS